MTLNIPMDLLRNFVAIANTGSLIRASEHVHLTQSALSLQMKRLSELVGQPIFKRSQGKLSLTPAGKILLSGAREMLALNDRVFDSLNNEIISPVSIGITQVMSDICLDKLIGGIVRYYPDININVVVDHSKNLKELVGNGLINMVAYFEDRPSTDSVITSSNQWFGRRELLDLDEVPIAVMGEASVLRDIAIASLEHAGLRYCVKVESDSTPVLIRSVQRGLAITCMPQEFIGAGFFALPIPMPFESRVYYCIKRHQREDKSVGILCDLVSDIISNHVRS